MNEPYYFKTISELSKLIHEQKVSPVELTEQCLERIEKLNPKINAFITVLAGEAREEAKQAEKDIAAGNWRGPLHGIPVAFKDMYDTAGVKTTAAFEFFKDRVPQKDAVAVHALKEAGAIIVGKTNMHTLAMGTTSKVSFFGPVNNPWDSSYIAGGSCGGSAAAVASGMCYATVDTDAVGSTRLPAACCGVVGYKCTWGRLDNTGVLAGEKADPIILKLATVGIMARDVVDVALVADALADTTYAKDLKKTDASQHVGIVTNFGADEPIRKHFDAALSVVEKLGYTTTNTAAPIVENPDMGHMDEVRKTVNVDVFKDVEVLMLPTTATTVLKAKDVGENPQALSPQNTFFANYYGLPAISVPCGFDDDGLPIGIQFVGKLDDDVSVLRVALAYQNATDWSKKHPA